jgi:pimeloyl-CoA dehydrogenase small subunit
MDFDLSDDQRLLKDSVDRLVQDKYGFEARRGFREQPDGWSRDLWQEFAELGLLGLPFAESEGGFGGSPVDTGLVMEAFGHALVVEPYFPSVILCGALLCHGATAEQRVPFVEALIGGTSVLAYAQAERQSRYSLNDVKTTARPDGTVWRIDGQKGLVLHGDSADTLLVSARVYGQERDRDGIGLFAVRADAPGVLRQGYATQDGLRAAEITFENAEATALGEPGHALPAMERAQDEAIAALCAEAVGLMATMHDLTVDYLKTRKQFGRAIGENQALQHRSVDMYVSLEQARSMALYATMMAGSDDETERRRAIHAAKVQIGKSGRHIGQEAIQLHGGIGMTMEYSVGHYFKRMTMIERGFGDTQTHLSALAQLGGLIAA